MGASAEPVDPLGLFDQALGLVGELSAVPVGCLTGDQLLAWHQRVGRLRSMADALASLSLAESDPAAVDGLPGGQTVSSAVAATLGRSPRTVRSELALGQWLVDLPLFRRAFAAGEISREHLEVFRRAENPRTASSLAEAQEYLCDAARRLPWRQFLGVVRYWELGADPDGEEPREQQANRSCSYRRHPDGTVSGRFHLDPLAGVAFSTAMEQIVQRLWRHDHETGSTRTSAQRRADAFAELIMNGAANPESRVPSPLVHIVLSQAVAEDLLRRPSGSGSSGGVWPTDPDDVDGRCEFVDGTPVHPHWAAAAMATARFRRLVLGPDGEILDLGRTTRTFPRHLKQALLVAGRGRCQEPGCDAPVTWLEADHLIPWNRAGPTATANGQILCSRHNRLKGDRPPGHRPPEQDSS